jgi:hypothetical protein
VQVERLQRHSQVVALVTEGAASAKHEAETV